jgi:AraC-like DNA-binding protein
MFATAPASVIVRPASRWHPGAPAPHRPQEHAIALLRPPYERLEHQTGWSALDARPSAPGLIVGVALDRPVEDCAQLDDTIRRLRQRSPTTPVVLLLHLRVEDSLFLTAHASRVGVRAVVCAGQPLREALRRSLTTDSSLAEDVVDWLGLYGMKLSPLVSSLVLQIVALAPSHDTLTALLGAAGVPETSARFRMHKKRLPAPSRWYQAARALHAALRIQAEPNSCLLRLAHSLGYADHSALSQLLHRSFGVRPGVVRGTLGWEWLLERWLRAHRIQPVIRIGDVMRT